VLKFLLFFGFRDERSVSTMRRKMKDDILRGPIPPLACLDYDEAMEFWERESERFAENGWDAAVLLDWAIQTLLSSLMADSASRVFLPKTRTEAFFADDLIPLSAIEPAGRSNVPLSSAFLVSALWNNRRTANALCRAVAEPVEQVGDGEVVGLYIQELNLAIMDAAVHQAGAQRFFGHGSAVLDAYSLRDLESVLTTDGYDWVIVDEDGGETAYPVLDTRMAALYTFGVLRFCPERKHGRKKAGEDAQAGSWDKKAVRRRGGGKQNSETSIAVKG